MNLFSFVRLKQAPTTNLYFLPYFHYLLSIFLSSIVPLKTRLTISYYYLVNDRLRFSLHERCAKDCIIEIIWDVTEVLLQPVWTKIIDLKQTLHKKVHLNRYLFSFYHTKVLGCCFKWHSKLELVSLLLQLLRLSIQSN